MMLKSGDTIALVALSSPLVAGQSATAIQRALEVRGYRVWMGESLSASTPCGYAAAPPEIRANDLHRAFCDPEVNILWCVRGGSSSAQILPLLDYDRIAAHPKPFIGFSDVTSIHIALQQRCHFPTFYGPTANRIFQWGEADFSWKSLRAALQTRDSMMHWENPPGEMAEVLRPGEAQGVVRGGNLSLIAASLGTPWQMDARGCILFLEDVGESVYALDRMLTQLRYAGIFDAAAGVLLGTFTDCRNAYCDSYGPAELLRDFFADYPKPVIANVRSGHCTPMVTLSLGKFYRIIGHSAGARPEASPLPALR